jgi:hypothetical protein
METKLQEFIKDVEDEQVFEMADVVFHPLPAAVIRSQFVAAKGPERDLLSGAMFTALQTLKVHDKVAALLPIPMYNVTKHKAFLVDVKRLIDEAALNVVDKVGGAGAGAGAGATKPPAVSDRILSLLETSMEEQKNQRELLEKLEQRLTTLEESKSDRDSRDLVVVEEKQTAQEKADDDQCKQFFTAVDTVLGNCKLPADNASPLDVRLWKMERSQELEKFLKLLQKQCEVVGSGTMRYDVDRHLGALKVCFADEMHPPVRSSFIYTCQCILVIVFFCQGHKELAKRMATRWGIGVPVEAFPLSMFTGAIKDEGLIAKGLASGNAASK